MANVPVPATRNNDKPGAPASLWSDSLGRAATRAGQALLIAGLVWVIVWAVTRVPLVIIPVVIALILASAIAPLVRWLTAHGWPRALAVLASFVAILVVFGGVVTGVVSLIRHQWKELASRALAGVDQLHGFLNNGPIPVSDQEISAARGSVQKFFSSGSFGTDALTGVRTAGEIIAGMVLMAVILFFFLKDGEQIRGFLFGFLPARHETKAHRAADLSTRVLGGYVRGTAIIAAIDGLIIAVTLLLLGVPLAVPLAVFVFIGGFIPIIGATAAGTLSVLVALVSNGPGAALIVLIVLIGANQLEHHVLQPLLMGKVLHIHGLVILLSLAAGTMLAGVIGALLAVPLAAVGWTIIKTWSGRDVPGPEPINENAEGAVV
ncbi:AI-2E family transporter [Paenarthrobacter sp. DKR-5]|uniref:AI-2E family transporter n=1 Tax=Paenarthrobacter sp. DKR-5 TaxID=2835535 RepID=UPI0020280240|nr:AI-2E family transporter [Paenarthrobacter sp. DKR-5]